MIRNFMISFGLVSTVFDIITFGTLFYLAGKIPDMFPHGMVR